MCAIKSGVRQETPTGPAIRSFDREQVTSDKRVAVAATFPDSGFVRPHKIHEHGHDVRVKVPTRLRDNMFQRISL